MRSSRNACPFSPLTSPTEKWKSWPVGFWGRRVLTGKPIFLPADVLTAMAHRTLHPGLRERLLLPELPCTLS